MGTFKNPDVWKQNLAYQIGDFVLYNGVVYMAIKPVPAGTAMSADYWYTFDENGEVNVAQYATANVNVEGGGAQTTDVYLWNATQNEELYNVVPTSVSYISGVDSDTQNPEFSEISFEHVTESIQGNTVHGIHMSNVPIGAVFDLDYSFSWDEAGVIIQSFKLAYSLSAFPPGDVVAGICCPMPINNYVISGTYQLSIFS